MIKPQRAEAPNLPVYLWWLAKAGVPGLLAVERRFWRLANITRHPCEAWAGWRKWRDRPRIGEQVRDCRGEIHTVAGFGDSKDDLILEDGLRCSWMNCCDPVSREDGR